MAQCLNCDLLNKKPFEEVFCTWIKELPTLFTPHLSESALLDLELFGVEKLSNLCASSFALEMRIKKLYGALQGDSPEERYNFFNHTYLADLTETRRQFAEYHDLFALIDKTLFLWREQRNEFCKRLNEDFASLEEFFNNKSPLGKIVSIISGIGDPHDGGRSGYILNFESGLAIIYKPKNLNNARAFNDLLEACNKLGLTPEFKTYQILPREDYGWESFVEHQPCRDLSQVKSYFQRTGMLLCLSYLLDGQDLHFENLVAAGEYPVLIDLEVLFHPFLRTSNILWSQRLLYSSILTTGLLPFFRFEKREKKGIDLSGIGGSLKEFSTYRWKHINTDEMHLVLEKTRSPFSKNTLFLNEQEIDPGNYIQEISSGFERMYGFVQDNIPFFSEQIFKMAQHPARFIFRSTRVYALMYEQLYCPHALIHAATRERILQNLERFFDQDDAVLAALIDEERFSMAQGDIPRFTFQPMGCDLFARGKIFKNALQQAPHDVVQNRLKNMNRQDCLKQQKFIEQSFQIKKGSLHLASPFPKLKKASKKISLEDQRKSVYALAEELKKQSLKQEDGGLEWIGLVLDSEREEYDIKPLDDSLYSGKGGIALFFAALASVFQDKEWEEMAINTLKGWIQIWESKDAKRMIPLIGIGGMSGLGGIIYCFFYVGKLLHKPEFIQLALHFIRGISEEVEKDKSYDIISGSAGLLAVALSLYDHLQDPFLLDLAVRCGDHLCKEAVEIGNGALAWKHPLGSAYLGFSHGTSGILYSLLRLASQTHDQKYIATAKRALAFERGLFSFEKQNWAYADVESETSLVRWCHGATGIGLGRLACKDYFKDELFDEEITAAIKITQEHFYQEFHPSLCCGTLGRLEFLREAQKRGIQVDLEREDPLELLTQFSIDKNPHIPFGLMTGLAGIGYTMLKGMCLPDQKKLPQILLLE
jgi:type 2 lantibiotic biosynthesis protein LanM